MVFVAVQVAGEEGLTVPVASNEVAFCISGPGELVATDNGDPACMTEFIRHYGKPSTDWCWQ